MTEARPRPAAHFAVEQGFTNDPCGVVREGGLYHLFFQYNPLSTHWAPACHWGHATSPDLMSWTEVEVAISPEPGEIGCWSGSVAVDETGPVIAYTRIVDESWEAGQVALARPAIGMSGWSRVPRSAVITGPPPGLAVSALRDPFVWRDGGRWKAVLGGALDGLGGCAIQFSSPDLVQWSSGGVLAQPGDDEVGSPVGQVWECPQFFELDGDWVLLVSLVLAGQDPGWVAYALGHYDGARFEPRTWGRLTHGTALYASSAFTDVDSQRCIVSWFRESVSHDPASSAWASAMSLPHRLTVSGDRLSVSQHQSLDSLLPARRTCTRAAGREVDLGPVAATWRISAKLELERGSDLEIEVGDGRQSRWSLSFDSNRALARITQHDGSVALEMPLSPQPGAVNAWVDLVVDSDLAELTCSDVAGIGAARIPYLPTAQLTVHASRGALLHDVVVAEPTNSPRG